MPPAPVPEEKAEFCSHRWWLSSGTPLSSQGAMSQSHVQCCHAMTKSSAAVSWEQVTSRHLYAQNEAKCHSVCKFRELCHAYSLTNSAPQPALGRDPSCLAREVGSGSMSPALWQQRSLGVDTPCLVLHHNWGQDSLGTLSSSSTIIPTPLPLRHAGVTSAR